MGQLKKILREQILAEMTYERQMSDEEIADLIDRRWMRRLRSSWENSRWLWGSLSLTGSYLTLCVSIFCRSGG